MVSRLIRVRESYLLLIGFSTIPIVVAFPDTSLATYKQYLTIA